MRRFIAFFSFLYAQAAAPPNIKRSGTADREDEERRRQALHMIRARPCFMAVSSAWLMPCTKKAPAN